jgi:hypothetical protein
VNRPRPGARPTTVETFSTFGSAPQDAGMVVRHPPVIEPPIRIVRL